MRRVKIASYAMALAALPGCFLGGMAYECEEGKIVDDRCTTANLLGPGTVGEVDAGGVEGEEGGEGGAEEEIVERDGCKSYDDCLPGQTCSAGQCTGGPIGPYTPPPDGTGDGQEGQPEGSEGREGEEGEEIPDAGPEDAGVQDAGIDAGISDAGIDAGVQDTWYDSASNLTWKVNPAGSQMTWANAKSYCTGLGGGWRLPTVGELRSLIRGCAATQTGGSCGVTDSCLNSSCWNSNCDGCSSGGGPDNGCYWPAPIEGSCSGYWYCSSSPVADIDNRAWYVNFYNGYVNGFVVNVDYTVRCVR